MQIRIQFRAYFVHWQAIGQYIGQGFEIIEIISCLRETHGIFLNKTFKTVIRGAAESVQHVLNQFHTTRIRLLLPRLNDSKINSKSFPGNKT